MKNSAPGPSPEPVKPRYKAAWLKRLKEYPERRCEVCAQLLLPRVFKNQKTGLESLESPKKYASRRFCSHKCRGKVTGNPLGRRPRKTKKTQPARIAKQPAPPRPRKVEIKVELPAEARAAVVQALALDHLSPEYFIETDQLAALQSLRQQSGSK